MHKWFRRFPFQRLLYRRLKPPSTPQLLGPSDTKYFLKLDSDGPPPPSSALPPPPPLSSPHVLTGHVSSLHPY